MDVDTACVFSVSKGERHRKISETCRTYFSEVIDVSIEDDEKQVEGDICVSVGGDGTYLESVYRCAEKGIPVLGVNEGSLGFLSRIPPTRAGEAFESVVEGDAEVIERGRVQVECEAFSASGLNEVMVRPVPPTDAFDQKICKLHVYIDDTYVGEMGGSGIAVATPTGSTAVSLSAGGPIHYPNNNFSLQLTPLEIHNMGVRPLIFDGDMTLRVYPKEDVNVLVDGGRGQCTLEVGQKLSVTGSETAARLVRTPVDESFFDSLSGKLGWGPRGVDETGPYEI